LQLTLSFCFFLQFQTCQKDGTSSQSKDFWEWVWWLGTLT
jgi:hypothetical protein